MLGTNLGQIYDLQIRSPLPWMAFSFCWWFLGCADAFSLMKSHLVFLFCFGKYNYFPEVYAILKNSLNIFITVNARNGNKYYLASRNNPSLHRGPRT